MTLPISIEKSEHAGRPNQDFGPSSWKYVLKLLGLIVVADGRVLKEKVDAFQDVMMELAVVIDPKIVMTRRMVFDWFVYHKDELKDVIDSLEYDSQLIAIFKEIRNMPHKLDVVNAMLQIALSDDVYSAKEKMFIKKTILYWNIRGGDQLGDMSRPVRRERRSA